MTGSGGPRNNDPMDDATMVRPERGSARRAARADAAEPGPAPDAAGLTEGTTNPLIRAASPLLMLAVQLRHSFTQPDVAQLREQAAAHVRRFEAAVKAAGVRAQVATAARYVLCTMLDESVLRAPWGEASGWAQKTLLVTFHGESYGGAKFFQILERLYADAGRHIDLMELMYVCLALGFAGRYQIESGGRARLADIQADLHQRIRTQRAAPAKELAPHWRGIEDRRNRLIRYVPLWVVAAAGACVVLGVFVFFNARLNAASAPISAAAAQVGLENVALPDTTKPPKPPKTLQQLLQPAVAAGKLDVIEQDHGRELVRIQGGGMFASGGVEVKDDVKPVLHRISAALNQVPGRLVVIGNTDDVPIHSLTYKDNFALSAARAKAVVKILDQGLDDPGRLEYSGAGSSRPIALPPDVPANRARNRRVDLIYIPEG